MIPINTGTKKITVLYVGMASETFVWDKTVNNVSKVNVPRSDDAMTGTVWCRSNALDSVMVPFRKMNTQPTRKLLTKA